MPFLKYIALSVSLLTPLCAKWTYLAEFEERGYIECFDESFNSHGRIGNHAAASAAIFDGKRIIIANDKPINKNKTPPLFYINYDDENPIPLSEQSVQYMWHPLFRKTRKIESLTITPNNSHVIASTGFSSIGPMRNLTDYFYNMMLVFPANNHDRVQVVSPTKITRNASSSIQIKSKIRHALRNCNPPEGPPYFNMEGLATVPGKNDNEFFLLMGIRQVGHSYENFRYAAKILVAKCAIDNDQLLFDIDNNLSEVYEFHPTLQVPDLAEAQKMGISDLAYDIENKCLYVLTAFEIDDSGASENLGAYLWTIPMRNLTKYEPPFLAHKANFDPNNNKVQLKPFKFAHKMEGLTILEPGKIFVIADDDYVTGKPSPEDITDPENQFSRKHNQAAYAIVNIVKQYMRE